MTISIGILALVICFGLYFCTVTVTSESKPILTEVKKTSNTKDLVAVVDWIPEDLWPFVGGYKKLSMISKNRAEYVSARGHRHIVKVFNLRQNEDGVCYATVRASFRKGSFRKQVSETEFLHFKG